MSPQNEVHQADLLFLPFDTGKIGRTNKTYKYALTMVDVATRYKEAELLTFKEGKEVVKAFEKIYSRHFRPVYLGENDHWPITSSGET